MPELLLELFSEEIPARMQVRAAEDLKRLVRDGLTAAGLQVGDAYAFATPRRLALSISDVPLGSEAVSEERKGPRVGAPDKAVQGFLRAAGLKSLDEAEVVSDPKKGEYYLARIEKPGRNTSDIVAAVVPAVVANFPWPKSMRWGAERLQWVRPLQSILCIFDGAVVPFSVQGISSGNTTRGHRFLSPEAFAVEDTADYIGQLKAAKVMISSAERAEDIARQAAQVSEAVGLELVPDDALLAENAGLVEWPTVLMGTFDEAFLEVPGEVLTTSMRSHQKCFSLRDPATGKLTNRFLLVSNMLASDEGKAITAGNERVIRARLSDAQFFWDQDLKRPLDEMATALKDVTYHEKLGTQAQRVERVADLAHRIAGPVDADEKDARRAAQLAKSDLVSGMVGEFPELQGLMGRYYAEAAGTKPEIAVAIEEHYKPKGAGDDVPTAPVSVAVALADKIDQLVGFWAIDEKPTGSGDPYQLRRAALGVIRICVENDLRLGLTEAFVKARGALPKPYNAQDITLDLIAFFHDRLKVYLRDQGQRHDLIDAIIALGGQDDMALIVRRVEALSEFLETDDGANLLAGVKRAANILRIEEKKDGRAYDDPVDASLLTDDAENALHTAIEKVGKDISKALDVENFGGAMRALAELRAPVDAFFEDVKVNADDPAVRANRLGLLSAIRTAASGVTDFAKIEG